MEPSTGRRSSRLWAAEGAGDVAGRELERPVAAGCGATFPLRGPRRRIDVLLADPRLVVQDVQVPRPGPVTDHLPLVLDLAWPREAGAHPERSPR